MAIVDLRFLNEFVGVPINLEFKLDPEFCRGQTESMDFGFVTRENTEEFVYFRHESISCPVFTRFPYIGVRNTVWKIQRLDGDREIFLDHRKVGDKKYEILGPRQKVLGILSGIDEVYKTGYTLSQVLESEVEREKFAEWRRGVILSV